MALRTRSSRLKGKNSNSNSSLKSTQSISSNKVPLSFGGENNSSITTFLKPQRSLSSRSTFSEDVDFDGVEPPKPKGKGKGKEKLNQELSSSSNELWSEIYTPSTVDELAVHSRKVKDIENWIQESLSNTRISKYRKILLLDGTAGSGKSTTVKLLAKKLNINIIEYSNDLNSKYSVDDDDLGPSRKFANFLGRSVTYKPLSFNNESTSNRQLILIEDLPNVLELHTRQSVHDAFRTHCNQYRPFNVPIVVIISDSGVRGSGGNADENAQYGSNLNKDVIDTRAMIPNDILDGPYCITIHFNPIAKSFLKKHLNLILDKHAQMNSFMKPHDEALDIIINSCHGDIRSAINTLQIISTKSSALPGSLDVNTSSNNSRKRKSKALNESTRNDVENTLNVIARREVSLNLFHSLGKVLYNKRHGTDENNDCNCDKMIPTIPLPEHLKHLQRERSHVNPTALFTDIPVDVETYLLYLSHNYTSFTKDCDDAFDIADCLSWSDQCYNYSLGETRQLSSMMFEYVVRRTLHSLPSPSIKRGQKLRKPTFYLALKETKQRFDILKSTSRSNVTLNGQVDINSSIVDTLSMLTKIWKGELCIFTYQ